MFSALASQKKTLQLFHNLVFFCVQPMYKHFQKTRLTNVSLKPTTFSSFMSLCLSHVFISSSRCKFGTLAVAFHQVVISRLSACCSLDWHPAYQLYGTAISHIITISVRPWALTNAVGHRPFVNFCIAVSV